MDGLSGRLLALARHKLEAIGREAAFALRLPDGREERYGGDAPAFVIAANGPAGLSALASLDRTRMAEAYLGGEIDIEGDLLAVLALRERFGDSGLGTRLWQWLQRLASGQVAADARWIAHHYDEDPDFYRLFLDRRHRCYSQAVFAGPDEPLEEAMSRKLDWALDRIGVQPGQRVLDVGGGWGAFTEHAGRRGIAVTSLTISRASEAFINELIRAQGLPCRVQRTHLMAYEADAPYDAIVNLGVTEHLPDYPASLAAYRRLLRPGGRIALDASAARTKHDLSGFFLRHIFQGNGSPLCLHDYLAAVADSPFEVVEVINDRDNYGLTCRHWAQALDRHAEEIVRRWGLAQYRRFRLYLWGCVDGFARDVIQAYRWVLALPA